MKILLISRSKPNPKRFGHGLDLARETMCCLSYCSFALVWLHNTMGLLVHSSKVVDRVEINNVVL